MEDGPASFIFNFLYFFLFTSSYISQPGPLAWSIHHASHGTNGQEGCRVMGTPALLLAFFRGLYYALGELEFLIANFAGIIS